MTLAARKARSDDARDRDFTICDRKMISGSPLTSCYHCSVLSMARATAKYISASVNRFNYAADCSSSSLIAFGSGNLVALWDASVCCSSESFRIMSDFCDA